MRWIDFPIWTTSIGLPGLIVFCNLNVPLSLSQPYLSGIVGGLRCMAITVLRHGEPSGLIADLINKIAGFL